MKTLNAATALKLGLVTAFTAISTGCATFGGGGQQATTEWEAGQRGRYLGNAIQRAIYNHTGGRYSNNEGVNGYINAAVGDLPGVLENEARIRANNEGYIEQDVYYENGELIGTRGRGHRHTRIPASAPKPR